MSFKGTVKAFRTDKGFGFITADDGSEVFVHAAACVDGGQPQQGDQLTFDVEESKMKPGQMQACNVSGGTGVPGEKGAGKGKDKGGPPGSMQGQIKSFGPDKGFGFIIGMDGTDLFCHLNAVVDGSVPLAGDSVTYDVEPSKSKPGQMTACNVRGGTGTKGACCKGGFGAAKGGDWWGGGKGGPYGGGDSLGWGGDSWGGKGGGGGDSWGGKGGGGGGGKDKGAMMQMMMSMMGGGGKGGGGGGWGGGGDSWSGGGDSWGGKGGGGGDSWGGKGGSGGGGEDKGAMMKMMMSMMGGEGKGGGGKGGW